MKFKIIKENKRPRIITNLEAAIRLDSDHILPYVGMKCHSGKHIFVEDLLRASFGERALGVYLLERTDGLLGFEACTWELDSRNRPVENAEPKVYSDGPGVLESLSNRSELYLFGNARYWKEALHPEIRDKYFGGW